MAETLVLGAGIVGLGAALALQERGHAVTLIDRDPPGRATSYGNAGVIQAEAMEPYAMPLAAGELWRIATGRSNDVRWTLRGVMGQGAALLSYAGQSRGAAHARIIRTYRQLIAGACSSHAPLIAASGADDLIRRDGYLELFRSPRAMQAGRAMAQRFQSEYGVGVHVLDPAGLARIEPGLNSDQAEGALHWTDPWTVADPAALSGCYADLFLRRGGRIVRADAMELIRHGSSWRVGSIGAEHAVIALGPWSPALTARYGLRVPMVRKRGYHRHYRVDKPPRHTLVDIENGVVFAPMQQGLRICTGADLSANPHPNPPQLLHGEAAAGELFGDLTPAEAQIWTGIRPCLPDMLPVVGAIPGQPGLWADFGHGHHGLTLAAVTGAVLADAMEGNQRFPALSPARFARQPRAT